MRKKAIIKYRRYVILMYSQPPNGDKEYYKITVASNVQKSLDRHNREEKCLDPSTAPGAPTWQILCLFGPMKHGSNSLAERWRKSLSKDKDDEIKELMTKAAHLQVAFPSVEF